jgi:hypothetical protein
MGMKNANSTINFDSMAHVNRNIFDQKNQAKRNFINAHNL